MKKSLSLQAYTACIVLAVAALALAYLARNHLIVSLFVLGLGVLWLLNRAQRWKPLGSLIFVGYTLACVLGYWLQLPMSMLVLGITAALGAWDLDHFCQRVHTELPVVHVERLERHHLQQLVIVLAAGLAVAAFTLGVQVSLGFWALFFISLAALFCLARVLTMVDRDEN
jgi:hypothetical protein